MSRSARPAVTWVEVLVVLGILVVAVGMLLPATRRVRAPAERSQCVNNLKQLMIAMHSFADTDRSAAPPPFGYLGASAGQWLPPGCYGPGTMPVEDRLSWMVAVLPYMDQNALYQQFDADKGYAGNLPVAQTRIKMFVCPSAATVAVADPATTYVALSGVVPDAARLPAGDTANGFMGYDRLTSMEMIKDGTSNTIALMETRADPGPWARGGTPTVRGFDPAASPTADRPPFGGCHPVIINTAMADGSVRTVRVPIDPKALAAWVTIAGGEPVTELD